GQHADRDGDLVLPLVRPFDEKREIQEARHAEDVEHRERAEEEARENEKDPLAPVVKLRLRERGLAVIDVLFAQEGRAHGGRIAGAECCESLPMVAVDARVRRLMWILLCWLSPKGSCFVWLIERGRDRPRRQSRWEGRELVRNS